MGEDDTQGLSQMLRNWMCLGLKKDYSGQGHGRPFQVSQGNHTLKDQDSFLPSQTTKMFKKCEILAEYYRTVERLGPV